MATTISIILFAPLMRGSGLKAVATQVAERPANVTTDVGGWTDNRGNKFALNHLMSTRYPLCVVLMELASVMAKEGIRLALKWVPRESNQEADDLSNMKTEAFDPKMRLDFDPATHAWEVLNSYLEAGRLLHEEAQAMKEAKRGLSPEKTARSDKRRKRPRHSRLKFTDP